MCYICCLKMIVFLKSLFFVIFSVSSLLTSTQFHNLFFEISQLKITRRLNIMFLNLYMYKFCLFILFFQTGYFINIKKNAPITKIAEYCWVKCSWLREFIANYIELKCYFCPFGFSVCWLVCSFRMGFQQSMVTWHYGSHFPLDLIKQE